MEIAKLDHVKLRGKFTAVVKNEDGTVASISEGSNTITLAGQAQIVNWLNFNGYGTYASPGLMQINTTGMTVTNTGFTNAQNVIDGNATTYATASISSTSWSGVWWQIDLGSTSNSIAAISVDYAETVSGYGTDYKFQYSSDGTTWTDFSSMFRPSQTSAVRSQVLFYVNPSPPFVPVSSIRYIRFNTIKLSSTNTLNLYEVKLFTFNVPAQPPLVMQIGNGTTTPSQSDIALSGTSLYTQAVTNSNTPSNSVANFVMSMATNVGNGITFSEGGMFFNPSNSYTLQNTVNATSLFSHALFTTPWSKTSTQTADVYYQITVSSV